MKHKQIKDSKDELQEPTNITDEIPQENKLTKNINEAKIEYLEFIIVKR